MAVYIETLGLEMTILDTKWCSIMELDYIAGLILLVLLGHSNESGSENLLYNGIKVTMIDWVFYAK